MDREFIYVPQFLSKWFNLGLTEDDLIPLELYLLDNPQTGEVMQGTGGIRKMRWALPNKGKSGSMRIMYIDLIIQEKTVFFDMFPKGAKDNLSQAEKNELKKIVKEIIKELNKNE